MHDSCQADYAEAEKIAKSSVLVASKCTKLLESTIEIAESTHNQLCEQGDTLYDLADGIETVKYNTKLSKQKLSSISSIRGTIVNLLRPKQHRKQRKQRKQRNRVPSTHARTPVTSERSVSVYRIDVPEDTPLAQYTSQTERELDKLSTLLDIVSDKATMLGVEITAQQPTLDAVNRDISVANIALARVMEKC